MGQLIGLLFLAGFVLAYFWWIVAAVAIWWAYQGYLEAVAELETEHAARVAEGDRLVANADREHGWILADDERGIFGEFPPALGQPAVTAP